MDAAACSEVKEPLPVEGYYRWQSRIYDATRWSFLFGRSAVIDRVARLAEPKRILEVGCGTGRNLSELARRFPQARLTGLDVSADMLRLTEKKMAAHASRVTLVKQRYDTPVDEGGFDLVLCSYALSMFNPGWEEAVECAVADLAPGGLFALVDFHDSRFAWFRHWMGVNHVRMEGHLLPGLEGRFQTLVNERQAAYGGVWNWVVYVGRKIQAS
jgi:S-adenosylmethionine-diacylgycerolhomoserine-N-methlytransferase